MSVVDFAALILGGLGFLGYWRLLKRKIRTKGICCWFPTTMLTAMASLVWASDLVGSSTLGGSVFEIVTLVVAGMNVPALIVSWLLGGVLMDHLPIGARVPFACALFWGSWHLVLRFLLWRTRLESPIALNLSD